ncbi:9004_t:CDS:2, partial [Funneliformis geosporum]
GFKEYTTASEAMKTMRPYNGRTCYFHGCIAYFAFATEEDMLNACKIRISHNEYLLDDRSCRLNKSYTPQHTPPSILTQPKTFSYNNSFTLNPQQSAARRYVDNNFTDLSLSSSSQKEKDRTDDILNITTSSLSLEIFSLGYMDDANWISNYKENLEDILSIANKFYGFTRAAINKNKSQLITNSSGCPTSVPLKFVTSILNLPPERSSIHFLRKKPLTDKQICYITNMVLFSLLEYRLQTIPLSKNKCIRISSPIRTLIKNNSHFAISAPNYLFTRNIFYQLRDL